MNSNWKIIRIGLKQFRAFKRFKRLGEEEQKSSSIPQILVNDILDLGPTFIKFGQILSTRPDVLPTQYIQALELLQERVPPFPVEIAKQTIEEELEKPIEQIFSFFEDSPVASASLAQVHFGRLISGEEVAVKVQRPYVKAMILHDLHKLEKLLKIIRFLFPAKIRRANFYHGFLEFKRYTLQELDFQHEGEVIEKFRENFQSWDDVIFPRYYPGYSTEKVLTMDRVGGLRLKEAVLHFSASEKEKLAIRLAEMELKMFISDGLFHADLHPGNIFFQEDGKIVLLDFGLYGILTKEERNRFVLYWLSVVKNDVKRAFYHFKLQCEELPGADEKAFFELFKKLANEFYHNRLKDVSLTRVYLKMINGGYKFGFVFPENLLLHAKALTTAEALTFELFPEARFEKITRPFITKEFLRLATNGEQIKNRLLKTLPEFMLTGDLVPASFQSDQDNAWNLPALVEPLMELLKANIQNWKLDNGIFPLILNPPARLLLLESLNPQEVEEVLEKTWVAYSKEKSDLAIQKTLGGSLMLQLASVTHALYKALLNAGKSAEEATDLVFRIGWEIYTKMGEYPLLIASIFSNDPSQKLSLSTQIFRKFPFSYPDYAWEDVPSDKGTVAFNCTRCQVAEYFKQRDLGGLCYDTWCKLDFPLAEQWGGKLERSGSIAGGATVCDFRWITEKSE